MALQFLRSWSDDSIELFRKNVARFCDDELLPDDEAARKRGNVGRDVWVEAGRHGFLCTDIPEEWGGSGGDVRHEAVVDEELSRRGLTGFGTQVHSIVAHYILNHGTEEQKSRFLPKLARGELIGAIAMTEPGAGSDLQSIRSKAELCGTGYRLNGAKTFITNGLLAGVVLVVCKTKPADRARGISILIVETEGCQGFRVGRVLDKVGLKAQDTAELFFDDVIVPQTNLLGGVEGQGFVQLMSDLPYERLLIAICGQAAMEGAYGATLSFVREREVFGQALAALQNTKFKLAEVATKITVGRALVDRCIEQYLQASLDTATASIAKLWISETQGQVMDELLQLHGGYGYMNEYLIARLYADARIQRIYGGTSEIMKEVIARAL